MCPLLLKTYFCICILKNMYISCDLCHYKVKRPRPFPFFGKNIPNIYSYIRLYFVFEKSVTFFALQLCFLKIWCGFGSYMKSIFSQTEYSVKTKFLQSSQGWSTTSKISKTRLNLRKVLLLRGYKVEKMFFSSFLH